VVVRVGDSELSAYGHGDREFISGTSVTLYLPPDRCKVFPADN